MKSREFTIDKTNLEIDDIDFPLDILEEYIFEELEIPQEYIKSCDIDEESLHIKLTDGRRYFNDDWYVNLQRVA